LLGPTCALLGTFVNLRGMSFFSDALAHSAITGVALGFMIDAATGWKLDPTIYVLVFSCLLALAMGWLSQRTPLSRDTITAFTFTGSVALGVILISMLGKSRMLEGLLFGSIYSNGPSDIIRQALLAIIVFTFFLTQLRPLALATLDPELARSRGVRPAWLHYGFSLLVAATVAVGLKMLGALLLSALIVMPAAAARIASTGFRGMLLGALLLGIAAPPIGIAASAAFNLPTGPSIVLVHVAALAICQIFHLFKNREVLA
ncbi:MAG: metal ABC transporter permease, partial [Akkermansiaceae bacterium]|nr:metal ABC transporter permease [Akkermansiaceae bacterium]